MQSVWAEILKSGLHDVFFNVNNFLHNMAGNVGRTFDDFAKLLKTIFEEDDPKVTWIVS